MSGNKTIVSFSSYRKRRSFRKLCCALFVIVAVFIWHSRIPRSKSKRTLLEEGFEQQKLDPKPRPPDVDIEDFGLLRNGHHHPSRPFAIATPTPHTPATDPVNPGYRVISTPRSMSEYDNDEHEQLIDSINTDIYPVEEELAFEVKLLHQIDHTELAHRVDHQTSSRQIQIPTKEVTEQKRSSEPSHSSEEIMEGMAMNEIGVEDSVGQSIYTQESIEDFHEGSPGSEHYRFPTQEECESIKQKVELMPDFTHVPFEESVQNIVLEGWEDEWVTKARYSGPHLDEPKIDIVYNCELIFRALHYLTDMSRRGQWLAARVHPDHASIRTQLYAQRSRQHMDFIAQIQ
jgi:hypothetical protein